MSVFAAHVAQRSAIVAGDTVLWQGGRVIGFGDKILPMFKFRAVAFSTGYGAVLDGAELIARNSPELDGVDQLAEALPGALRQTREQAARSFGMAQMDVVMGQIVLIGYCEKAGRMRVWAYADWLDGFAPNEMPAENFGLAVMPPPPTMLSLGHLAPERQVFEAMLLLKRHHVDIGEPDSVGGEVIAWTIGPDAMSCRAIHRFEDYDTQRAQAEANIAAIMRGDWVPDATAKAVPTQIARDRHAETLERRGVARPEAGALPAPPMNRQQRRQLERQQKKARA